MAVPRSKSARKSSKSARKSSKSARKSSKSARNSSSSASKSKTSNSATRPQEHTDRPKNPDACLQALPAELRSTIFEYAFTRDRPLKVLKKGTKFVLMSRQHHQLVPGVLSLRKRFLHEAAPMLYGKNTFSIASRDLPEFLGSIGEANRKLLQRFAIHPDSHISWALRAIARCPKLKEIELVAHIIDAKRLVRVLLPHAVRRAKAQHTSLSQVLSFVPEPSYVLSLALGDEDWQEDIEEELEQYAEEVLSGLMDALALKGLPSTG